jgi:hypothetical protein
MNKAVPLTGVAAMTRPSAATFPDLDSPVERLTSYASRVGGISAFVVAVCALAYQFA